MKEICSRYEKPRNGVEVNVTVKMPKMLCITPPSQEESTRQIWVSYLECYRLYAAPDVIILETRS